MSFETLRPLFLLAIVGALFRGFLAALILPNGVDEGVMLDVAPVVTLERLLYLVSESTMVFESVSRKLLR